MESSRSQSRAEKLYLEAARTFNSTLEYEELIESVLRLVIAAAGSEAAFVFRVDHQRPNMKIRFLRCPNCVVRVFYRELGKGVIDWVARYREPVIINNAAEDPRVDHELGRLSEIEIRKVMSVPLIGKGQMIGVIEAVNRINGDFTNEDLDVLVGLANLIAVAIDNAALYRAVKREALEKQLLYETGMKLSGSLQLDEVMREILNSLRQAVQFDGAGVYLINPKTNWVDSVYSTGFDGEADTHMKVGQGLVGFVAQSGQPLIVPDVRSDARYVGARSSTVSEIVVPIMLDGRTIGVFNLESDQPGAFDHSTRSIMAAFAAQAAISIERARLHMRLIASQKLDEQVHIAREIQRSFLPGADPVVAGYDLAGTNVPSFDVGGDYYDFIDIVEGQTGIAIGDVSGKGIPAALIMASFRASLIAEIRNNYAIRTICRKVNNLLYESVQAGTFVTAVYGVLDSRNHVLTFTNCGHNRPLLLRHDGQVEELAEGGLVLGVVEDADYEERPIYLFPGDLVLWFTDGVTEVFDREGHEFGNKRLLQVMTQNRNRSCREILNAVYDAVTAFAAPDFVFDDLTAIAIRRQQ